MPFPSPSTTPPRLPLLLPVLLLALLVSTVPPATAQDRERQSRDVASFSEVAYSLPGTLHLRQGDEHALAIEATPEVLDKIDTSIDGNTLKIRSEHQSSWISWLLDSGDDLDGADIDVYVTAPRFEGISQAGSGNVVGETPFDGSSFEVDMAGSGDLDLEIDVQELEINVAGSGTTRLAGRVGSAKVSIAGSGDVYLPETDEIEASIAGSGNVWYDGDPQIESSIFGSGTVRSNE